jgi:hypothetical protein
MRRSSLLAAIPALALVLAGTVSAVAQDEETEANRSLTPDLCQIDPRTEEELIAAFGLDAESMDEAPSIPRAEISIPLGQPAPGDVIQGVTDTIRLFFACNNAGDVPRTTALLSESGLLRFYGFGPRDEALDQQLRSWAAGEATPREENDYIRLLAITDVSLLPDGRVAAFVINNEPLLPPRGPETLLFVFSQGEDGRWLIDDYHDFTVIAPDSGDAGTPAAGTPATE